MSTKADIIAAVIEPAIALARFLWHKAHGEDTQPDEAELKRIALASLTAQLQRAELELQRLAAVAGVPIAVDVLARALIELRDAIRAAGAAGGMVGRVLDGIEITVLGPGEEMPVETTVAAIGEDERIP